MHGRQHRPLFRVQAPLQGQETSTDPWSYLTRMANFSERKKCMNENVVEQHFHFKLTNREALTVRDITLCTIVQYSKYKTASFAAHSTFITDPEQQVGSTYSTKIDKIQKSDIKTPLRRIMRKKASQRNTPLSFEKARIENTNT